MVSGLRCLDSASSTWGWQNESLICHPLYSLLCYPLYSLLSPHSYLFFFLTIHMLIDRKLLLLLSRFSHVRLCATPWMAAHQAPPSLGFSRQEYWSGLPFPSPMREKWKVKVKSLSRVRLLETPWTAAYQAPPSMGFSRQGYWSGLPLPSPREL